MSNVLEYKGLYTKVHYSPGDAVFYGKIENINDLVNFECKDVRDIKKEFYSAVDDYINICAKLEGHHAR